MVINYPICAHNSRNNITDNSCVMGHHKAIRERQNNNILREDLLMEVLGNGHCINVDSKYNIPYVKVWEEGKRKIYWINLPYEKTLDVVRTVSDILQKYGRDKKFWNILGDVLNSKYNVLDFETSKKKKSQTDNKPVIEINENVGATTNYAKIMRSTDIVEVKLYNNDKYNTVKFKNRKSWSHKKYVDKALEHANMNPSYDFRYGWEIV